MLNALLGWASTVIIYLYIPRTCQKIHQRDHNMCAKFERFRYYLGTAQIKVLNLCYSAPTTDLDDCEGCCISDLQHNLPALIGLSDYQDCLTRANITTDTLYAVGLSPKLTLPKDVELPCLHGRFRLEAVKQEGSQSQDNWWLVDLYTSGDGTIFLFTCAC